MGATAPPEAHTTTEQENGQAGETTTPLSSETHCAKSIVTDIVVTAAVISTP